MVGSQLVGLVPLQALLDAAAFYCERENLFVLEEEQRIRLVGEPRAKVQQRVGVGVRGPHTPGGTCSMSLAPGVRPGASRPPRPLGCG